ncbi:Polyketide cyclase/dehydrase and lipid transport superfamily protein [Raphanus sativus]|nr:Polyketide cyclase/dehydrase and lipid transport superfamily protein [Raphanus sativus]
MMDKSTPNMSYQAWRHEPQAGPDPMLAYFKTLEEDPNTGTTIVHWTKKFPFFCSDREYIIGRRIWESENKYYAVTKGVPYPALPKRDKPRRVELYFSSWIIKAVESRKGDGQLTACEVSLVHCEDMGIPKDVAKLGVRHGMWGAVKKLNSGLRAYQAARKSGAALSGSAQIARITVKLNVDLVETSRIEEGERGQAMDNVRRGKEQFSVDWKLVVVGGVALACGLHSSAIGKALMVGAGQRLARR